MSVNQYENCKCRFKSDATRQVFGAGRHLKEEEEDKNENLHIDKSTLRLQPLNGD